MKNTKLTKKEQDFQNYLNVFCMTRDDYAEILDLRNSLDNNDLYEAEAAALGLYLKLRSILIRVHNKEVEEAEMQLLNDINVDCLIN